MNKKDLLHYLVQLKQKLCSEAPTKDEFKQWYNKFKFIPLSAFKQGLNDFYKLRCPIDINKIYELSAQYECFDIKECLGMTDEEIDEEAEKIIGGLNL